MTFMTDTRDELTLEAKTEIIEAAKQYMIVVARVMQQRVLAGDHAAIATEAIDYLYEDATTEELASLDMSEEHMAFFLECREDMRDEDEGGA